MGKFIDLTGLEIGRLKVLELDRMEKSSYWKCECSCDKKIVIIRGNRLSGKNKTQSCGCIKKEISSTIMKRVRKNTPIINEIGNTYYYLTVIRYSRIFKKEARWICQCKCDSPEKEISGSQLRNGNIRSCGCLHKEAGVRKRKIDAPINKLFSRYKTEAKKRNLIFELEKHEFKELIKLNCYYCNVSPYQRIKDVEHYDDSKIFYYNGIDRIDSNLGYIVDNCIPCCGRCNEAKMELSQNDFKYWIEKVYNHFVNKL